MIMAGPLPWTPWALPMYVVKLTQTIFPRKILIRELKRGTMTLSWPSSLPPALILSIQLIWEEDVLI